MKALPFKPVIKMERQRMIDPNFWQSEDIARLSPFERLVFISMISNADDEGRGRANPTYLKSIIFPYDELRIADVANAISKICLNTSVTVYEYAGNKYYSFLNWNKWQTIDKAKKSSIPSPEMALETTFSEMENAPRTSGELVATDSRPKEKKEKVKEKRACEKVKFAEFVLLTQVEYDKLLDKFGEDDTKRMIETLDNYKGSSGKKYASDYRAILNWVVERISEEKTKNAPKKQTSMSKGAMDKNPTSPPSYDIDEIERMITYGMDGEYLAKA